LGKSGVFCSSAGMKTLQFFIHPFIHHQKFAFP